MISMSKLENTSLDTTPCHSVLGDKVCWLCICMQAGSPHILCLPHELGSIPPVNLISNMRTFHGLGTAQKLFFCLFTCYIPTISTMFIEKFPLLHYKHKHKQWWWLETQLVRIVSCWINNNNDPHFSNSRTVSQMIWTWCSSQKIWRIQTCCSGKV